MTTPQEEKTDNKTQEVKVTKENTSDAVFLVDSDKKTKTVKGTHLNFSVPSEKKTPEGNNSQQ
ncbi:MAG: hypothetical protein WA821_09375 [Anaerolineales bacterium]